MASVIYSYSQSAPVGQIVGAQHFGTNILFQNDEVAPGSDYPVVVQNVGAGYIRYPGGTITELYFDPSAPDATQGTALIGGEQQDHLLGLSEFLVFCQAQAIAPIIVLPTYRYFDPAAADFLVAGAEDEIKGFIRDVLAGVYGAVDIHAFEIGNEWYNDIFDWTATQVGALSSRIALWISEVIAESPGAASPAPRIFVQSGRGDDDGDGLADNAQIMAEFSAAEMAAVDGVVTHLYAATSTENPLILGGAIRDRLIELNADWGAAAGPGHAPGLIVTEWNIGNNGSGVDENGDLNTPIRGLMRSAPLLRIFTEMIANEVALATIWSAQTFGPSGLSNREIDAGTDLTPTGYLLRMMRQALTGTTLMDPTGDFRLRDAAGAVVGLTYRFQGDGRTVVYLSSGVGYDLEITAGFGGLIGADTHVQAIVLGAADGSQPTDYRAEGQLGLLTGGGLGLAVDDALAAITLRPYQTIQIVFTEVPFGDAAGVVVAGDDQKAVNDVIEGSKGNDWLSGHGGDDTIDGGQFHDLLDGGAGNDVLTGGHGEDTLLGGDGADVLSGGNAGDQLFGGAGNDRLSGGNGDDLADGGAGNDSVFGQGGADELAGAEGDDRLNGGHGDDMIRGGPGDDTLVGAIGDDTLEGGAGNDVLNGQSGADVFVFHPGEGIDRIAGFEAGLDSIVLEGFGFADAGDALTCAWQSGAHVIIDFAPGARLTVLNTDLGTLAGDLVIG